jgi:hypothetical protein
MITNTVVYRHVATQRARKKQDNSRCSVTAVKHVNIPAIAREPPITTIETLLKAVFSFGSAPRLYKEDPRPAEGK